MPVTLRSKVPGAAMALVAKWCVSRGEKVTILVPSPASLDGLRSQFTEEELVNVKFCVLTGATDQVVPS